MENVKNIEIVKEEREERIEDLSINEAPELTEKSEIEEESFTKKYKLIKPFEFEGDFIKEINLDFDRLCGKDLEIAAAELTISQKQGVLETEKAYLSSIVCRAANLPKEFMQFCSAKDYTYLTIEAQGFLLN